MNVVLKSTEKALSLTSSEQDCQLDIQVDKIAFLILGVLEYVGNWKPISNVLLSSKSIYELEMMAVSFPDKQSKQRLVKYIYQLMKNKYKIHCYK